MRLPLEQEAIRGKCFHPSGKFVEFPKQDVDTSIPTRFEKIAGQFPDRVAVTMRNRTLTYQELNQAANRLAHAILAQRGETQEPIALLMDHDIPLIVAIVGVLKAGKICVVLDPSFPKDRRALLYSCSASQGLKITFAALLNGAALYPFNLRQKGVADFAVWLNQEEITIFFSVPVVFRHFVSTITGEKKFPHLRIIQLGS